MVQKTSLEISTTLPHPMKASTHVLNPTERPCFSYLADPERRPSSLLGQRTEMPLLLEATTGAS